MIRQRTRAGLAAARPAALGNPELAARQAADAAERDEVLRPVLAELANLSARAIAAELNARKIPTPRGGVWHAETVIRVQRRLKD